MFRLYWLLDASLPQLPFASQLNIQKPSDTWFGSISNWGT